MSTPPVLEVKIVYLFANTEVVSNKFLIEFLIEDRNGKVIANPKVYNKHSIIDHEVRCGLAPSGEDLQTIVTPGYKEFRPHITLLIPNNYSDLVHVEDHELPLFPAKLAEKCSTIYTAAHNASGIPYGHHYFFLVTPRPGVGKKKKERIKRNITEVIKSNRILLQMSNIIVMESTNESYYSEIKKLVASLTCMSCNIDTRSVYHRIPNIIGGGCDELNAIVGPLFRSV